MTIEDGKVLSEWPPMEHAQDDVWGFYAKLRNGDLIRFIGARHVGDDMFCLDLDPEEDHEGVLKLPTITRGLYVYESEIVWMAEDDS